MSASERTSEMGSRLRLAREQAGLSQGQVAQLMQLHRPSISEMEAGRRKVSAEELAKLAEIYGVDVSWLAGRADTPFDQARVELAARELAKLKPEDLTTVLRLLETLKRSGE